MLYTLWNNKKGSVSVMALILTAGILVATIEFSVYTVNTVRQARNIDRSLVAYYTAESGAESALHQLRKRPINVDANGHVVLNPSRGQIAVDGDTNTSEWNLEPPHFSDTTDVMRTTRLAKHQSLTIPLYANQGLNPLDIRSMKVSWENANNCDTGASAWIQAKTSSWNTDWTSGVPVGTQLSWADPSDKIRNIRQYIKAPGAGLNNVIFNDVTTDSATSEIFLKQPMVVQVVSMYCDLYGVNVTFYGQPNAVGSITPMGNTFTIAPQGDYQGVRQELRLTLPNQQGSGLSSLFNYVLFSEKSVVKD